MILDQIANANNLYQILINIQARLQIIIISSERDIFRIDIPRFPKFHFNSIMESINRDERTIYTCVNLDLNLNLEEKDIFVFPKVIRRRKL